jgi:UrcA family protein
MKRITFNTRGRGLAAGLLITAMGLAIPTVVPAAKQPTEKVRIADLDLDTAKGQQAFERRLRVALDRVCIRPNDHLPRTRSALRQVEECKSSARNGALQQLQSHGVRLANAAQPN